VQLVNFGTHSINLDNANPTLVSESNSIRDSVLDAPAVPESVVVAGVNEDFDEYVKPPIKEVPEHLKFAMENIRPVVLEHPRFIQLAKSNTKNNLMASSGVEKLVIEATFETEKTYPEDSLKLRKNKVLMKEFIVYFLENEDLLSILKAD
jgi:hypothetical protein